MSGGHALVVGGTGMLRGLCLALAARGDAVTVVARGHARLSALVRDAGGLAGSVHAAPADYGDGAALAAAVRSGAIARGAFSLVVAWVHSEAPGALPLIADLVGRERDPPRLFHIRGSDSGDPSRAGDGGVGAAPGILYRRVVLGFVVEGGGSRWLTDGEICAGILRAVERDAVEAIVGTVRPWGLRPG